MVTRREIVEMRATGVNVQWRNRLWRYGPLILWLGFIFFASTGAMSASNTSRILRPLLLWLFPKISEVGINFAHFLVRKGGHFTEYAILALLAARAFLGSSRDTLRHRWLITSLTLVVIYSLLDEYHQAFVPSRTSSIYDSLIDMAGGLTALIMLMLWRARRRSTDSKPMTAARAVERQRF